MRRTRVVAGVFTCLTYLGCVTLVSCSICQTIISLKFLCSFTVGAVFAGYSCSKFGILIALSWEYKLITGTCV
ncbi:unnamed protein product [Allacma fusca]|uniref:Uncharacterized protein n=1 Tax=Allacma fusca TaxID=39272 RepID=A0A8J2Q7L0_9HEXA|nr:unnamed protein product [Allacma fusca]